MVKEGSFRCEFVKVAVRCLERDFDTGTARSGGTHQRVTRKNHQGVIAFISSVTYQKTEDLVPFLFEQGKNPLFVMLDGITDVRNFGAIARTCECAAVDAVIIPARNSVSVNADAMKTSAGALHTLPVCREHSLKETLQFLKNSGFHIVAATEKGDYDYTKADYTGPMCIIMGAEDKGGVL
mgnify:CR=1 FL=1